MFPFVIFLLKNGTLFGILIALTFEKKVFEIHCFYIVCFCIACCLLIIATHTAADSKRGKLRFGGLFAYLLLATYVIYMPILFSDYDAPTALLGGVINALQVISLDADYLESYEIVRTAFNDTTFSYLYSTVLGFLHFALPAVSAVTAYTFIVYCMTNLQMAVVNRHNGELFIFSEVNERTIFTAADLRKNCPRADIVFAGYGNDIGYKELIDELHCVFKPEPITELKIRNKARRQCHYFCFSSSGDHNLDEALTLASKLSDCDELTQKRSHIYIAADGKETETMIDSVNSGITDIQLIDENSFSVYSLLNEHPLYLGAHDGVISLLICGFNELSEQLFRTALWCGQLEGYKLKIRLLAPESENRLDRMRMDFPEVFSEDYDIGFSFYRDESEFSALLRQHGDASYICVCGSSDSDSISRALFIRRQFYKNDLSLCKEPFIAVHIRSDEKYSMVQNLQTGETNPSRRVSYDLVPFGCISACYSYSSLLCSDIEGLAKNVHMCYEDIFSDGPINVSEALMRYNELEVNKASNRANAMHIRYKLWLMGLDYTSNETAQEVDFEEYLTSDRLDSLMLTEHDRWMAFLRSEGWTTATLEEVEEYKKSGLSAGRHNCPLLMMHPYICPFDELIARSDALGLPDATVYDRELIARIPDILHDKWNVSGRKYKIIKKKSGGI